MASKKNDELRARTVEGPVNLYDEQKCMGTAGDKAIASRLGGHNYNIISNKSKDEIYMMNLRHDDHFVDGRNNATKHFFQRRRKFPGKVDLMFSCMEMPEPHPKGMYREQRRTELQLAQTENFQDFGAYQRRRHELRPYTPEKRRTLDDRDRPKLTWNHVEKRDFLEKKGAGLGQSQSLPTLPAPGELQNVARTDPRRGGSQLQNESANYASIPAKCTYAMNMELPGAQKLRDNQNFDSRQRVENYEFSVARKNNHYSSQEKLTRADPYYMRPKFSTTNNSVKYDLITNQRRFFHYNN